jgi:hypothetical protein
MNNKLWSVLSSIALLLTLVTSSQAAEPWIKTSTKTQTGVKIGAGTAVGAGIGALIGGGRGAAAGALLGGGVMAADSLAKRDSGQSKKTRTIGTVAAGTAVGAGLGAAIGGGKGAGIGALLGGGSSAIWASTRKDLKPSNYGQVWRAR